ncbi:MAG: RICIN domain-containing protein [Cloacibacillus sp.]
MKINKLFFMTLLAAAIAVCAGNARAEAVISGRYMIRQAQSSLVMTGAWLPNKTYGQGSPVIIFQNENNKNWRYWRIEPLAGGEYRVMWRDTNLALDLARGERANGVEILLWPWHGRANQRWRIQNGPHGAVFINVQTGLALDLDGDRRTPRNRYQGYEPNNSRAQGFTLVRLGGSSSYRPAPDPYAAPSYAAPAPSAPVVFSGTKKTFSGVRVRLTLPAGWRYQETPATKTEAASLELYAPRDESAITIMTGFDTDERASQTASEMSREIGGTKPKKINENSWAFETTTSGVKTLVIVTEDRSTRSLMILSVTNDNDQTAQVINSLEGF